MLVTVFATIWEVGRTQKSYPDREIKPTQRENKGGREGTRGGEEKGGKERRREGGKAKREGREEGGRRREKRFLILFWAFRSSYT